MASRYRLHSPEEWAALGERIRKARQKAGMTQVELGSRFGRDQSLVAKIERGERQVSALELRDLCSILSVTCSSILS